MDEGVTSITDILDGIGLAKDLIVNKDNIRSKMWEAITSIKIPEDIWNMVSDWFSEKVDKYSQGGDVAEYTAGRDVTAIAMIFFDPSEGLGKLLKKVLGKVKKVASVVTDNISDGLKKVILKMEKAKGPKLKKDLDTNPGLKKFIDESNNPEDLTRTWEKLKDSGFDELAKNPKALGYIDELKDGAKLGSSTTTEYRKTFKNAFPELGNEEFIVHHAIEQQVLDRYPGVLSTSEMHSLENLRGIPKDINSDIHLSQIRRKWDEFYDDFPPGVSPTKEQLLDKAKEIDDLIGDTFIPPIR